MAQQVAQDAFNWEFLHFIQAPFPTSAIQTLVNQQGRVYEDVEFSKEEQISARAQILNSADPNAVRDFEASKSKFSVAQPREITALSAAPSFVGPNGIANVLDITYDQAKLEAGAVLAAVDIALRRDANLLNRLFVIRDRNDAGVYCVYLYVQSQWQKIVVDGYLPRANNELLLPSARTELWLTYLVKALAKAHGKSYARLQDLCKNNPREIISNILGATFEDLAAEGYLGVEKGLDKYLLNTANGIVIAYKRGTNDAILVTSYDKVKKTVTYVELVGDRNQIGRTQKVSEKSTDSARLSQDFDRISGGVIPVGKYFAAQRKLHSPGASAAVFRVKVSTHTDAVVTIDQPHYFNDRDNLQGRLGDLRVFIAKESPMNVEYVASHVTANQKALRLPLKLQKGSYLFIVDNERKLTGQQAAPQYVAPPPPGQPVATTTPAQPQQQVAQNQVTENNEYTLGIQSDAKLELFQRLTDVDVNHALRATVRSYAAQAVNNIVVTRVVPPGFNYPNGQNDPNLQIFSNILAGVLFVYLINDSAKRVNGDLKVDEASAQIVQPLNAEVSGQAAVDIRPYGTYFSAYKVQIKAQVAPAAWAQLLNIRKNDVQAPSAGQPVVIPDDVNIFVDPRVWGQPTDLEFDEKSVDNMVLRRYIYKNAEPVARRWKGEDKLITTYTLSDINGLYVLYENRTTNQVLEEHVQIQGTNLRVANVRSPLLLANSADNNNSFLIKLAPKQSQLIHLGVTPGATSYSYSISNNYRVYGI